MLHWVPIRVLLPLLLQVPLTGVGFQLRYILNWEPERMGEGQTKFIWYSAGN